MALVRFEIDNTPNVWIDNLPDVKEDDVLLLDQRTEGWPLVGYYDKLHSKLKNPSNVIFATSNLLEEQLYSQYSSTNKMTVISSMYFATRYRGIIAGPTQIAYKQQNEIKTYSCLNRVYRDHRKALMLMLHERDLLRYGEVSHAKFNYINFNDYKHHSSFEQANIDSLASKLPLTLDQTDFSINTADNFYKETYLKTWVSVVTETFFSEYNGQSIFFSEKIYKPIRAHHPFILVSAPGSLKALQGFGFKTFSKWWDESYDNIQDPVDRLKAITNLIQELSTWSHEKWLATYMEMLPILAENLWLLLRTNWSEQFDELITI